MRLKTLSALVRQALGYTRATLDPSSRAKFGSSRDYLSAHACLSYSGWVGHGNHGDEWIFDALERLLRPYRLLAAEWGIPPQIRAYSALRLSRWHPFKARLLGGGTLFPRAGYLPQLLKPELRRQPLYAFGFAALDATFWSSRLRDDFAGSNQRQWGDLLRQARYIGVRDAETFSALSALGVPGVKIDGDPALALGDNRWVRARGGRRPNDRLKIGINLGSHDPIWGDQTSLRRALGSFITRSAARGHSVTFIPLSRPDQREGRILAEAVAPGGISFPAGPSSPDASVACILDQDLIITQRLHAAVLSCAFGIPTISLAYNPKCLAFMESMGLSKWAIRTDECTGPAIEALFDSMVAGYNVISADIWRRAEASRAVLLAASREILDDLDQI